MMKTVRNVLLTAGALIFFVAKQGFAQEASEHISKQFTFKNSPSAVVAIYNIWGDVKVEGYSGDKVLIEIDQTIRAENQASLAKARTEFKLGFDLQGDSLIAYTSAPYDSRPRRKQNVDQKRGESDRYTVTLNYVVKVPARCSLVATTVNSGTVVVTGVEGDLNVNNVNGPVTVNGAKGATAATTVNGNVIVSFTGEPGGDSRFYTVNGKIEVSCPSSMSADLRFKSMNGEFYTDFTETAVLPTTVSKTESKQNGGTTYKLNKNTGVRVGKGGKTLSFQTLNGNIYVKKS